MPHSTRLLFFAGSAREGSLNKKLARLAHDVAEANGIAATLADLGDYPMPIYDGDIEARDGPPENAWKLKALMNVHHGVFIAAPEYNASVTPLLKNAVDWVSRTRSDDEPQLMVYRTRVFALGSASPGAFGGMRGLLAMRQVLEVGLNALVLPDQIAIMRASDAFGDDGHLKDKSQMELLRAVVQKLARAAHVMRGENDKA
ncbi:MAG: NAD(P)H-dependent oxidoreductase [Hyphomicrobiaceae bacterium]|nr:NAD(P)H-dependent oxidoreductase [Hyphomicrobiaceae bacterium]